ncbi:hypothetical protein HPB50_020288 [Hyalomma asiaticum]|uniref:Uncharacterized protein n=1 Tax=Hyalomma asiaticum TaxID=266040 RepID=A0ACB7SY94_HYAAI|nr:hypothetical protein HPB50_020288 [Hyalomma asiaticum]
MPSAEVSYNDTTNTSVAASTTSQPEDAFQRRLSMLLKEQKLVLAPPPEAKSRRRRAVMQKAAEVWALFRGRHSLDPELQKSRNLPEKDECEETVYRGITWPATPPDKCAEMDCPNWNVGIMTWCCNSRGYWKTQSPNTAQCVQPSVLLLKSQQKYLADIIETVSDFVANNSLGVGGDLVAIVDLLDMGVARSDTGDNYPGRISSAAQALRVGGLTASTVDELLSRDKPWNEVPLAQLRIARNSSGAEDESTDAVGSGGGAGDVVIVFTEFPRLDKLLLDDGVDAEDPKQELNSPAISIRVGSEAPGLVLGAHVELALPMLRHDAENPTCVFWDTLINEWSPDGCKVGRRNGTHVVCFCQHLSNFAVLMDLRGALPRDERSTLPLRIITWTGCSASVLCLCLCVTVFGCFRNFRAMVFLQVGKEGRPESSEETRASLSPRFPPCTTEPSDESYVAPSGKLRRACVHHSHHVPPLEADDVEGTPGNSQVQWRQNSNAEDRGSSSTMNSDSRVIATIFGKRGSVSFASGEAAVHDPMAGKFTSTVDTSLAKAHGI